MTSPSGFKTKHKATELEAEIMKRLANKPQRAGIIQVYVKPTGESPPGETWTHTLISRRTDVPRTTAESSALHYVLNDMRQEFDLIPD